MTTSASIPAAFPVVLRAYPMRLWSETRQWFEEVRRELSLAGAAGSPQARALARHLTDLLASYSATLGGAGDRGSAALWTAFEQGLHEVEIDYEVVADAAVFAAQLSDAVDDLNARCRSGELLTLPVTDEGQAFMRWNFGQFIAQVNGEAPTPWPGRGPVVR